MQLRYVSMAIFDLAFSDRKLLSLQITWAADGTSMLLSLGNGEIVVNDIRMVSHI
jgi:hypothetical protein